jgi:hypothetical protein
MRLCAPDYWTLMEMLSEAARRLASAAERPGGRLPTPDPS